MGRAPSRVTTNPIFESLMGAAQMDSVMGISVNLPIFMRSQRVNDGAGGTYPRDGMGTDNPLAR